MSKHDIGAAGGAKHVESALQSSPAKQSSNLTLKTQLRDVLNSSKTLNSPPRIDVISAVDKLQNLSQLISDHRSKWIIEQVIQQVQLINPATLAKPGAVDHLIAAIIATQPISPPTPIQKPSSSTTRSMSQPTLKSITKNTDVSISEKARRIFKSIFG